jgi:hypothetical protein
MVLEFKKPNGELIHRICRNSKHGFNHAYANYMEYVRICPDYEFIRAYEKVNRVYEPYKKIDLTKRFLKYVKERQSK